MQDENGKEMRSGAAKNIQPKPAPEDLTRVRTGPGELDYEYLDPNSLFALERLVAHVKNTGDKLGVAGKGHRPFIREVYTKAYPEYWPPGGYVVRGPFLEVIELDGEPSPNPAFRNEATSPVIRNEATGPAMSEATMPVPPAPEEDLAPQAPVPPPPPVVVPDTQEPVEEPAEEDTAPAPPPPGDLLPPPPPPPPPPPALGGLPTDEV